MTRIIAGEHRGRRLQVPTGNDIRPTTDRMRERVFSMLGHARFPSMVGARVADVFAGTGALGLEALSRGAAHATFVDHAPASLDCIRTNIRTLGVEAHAATIRTGALNLPIATAPYTIIFMDPPYRMNLVGPTLEQLAVAGWIAEENVIVCETANTDPIPEIKGFEIVDERAQGQQRILFMHYRVS